MKSRSIQNEQVTPILEIRAESADYKSLFALQDLDANTVISTFSHKEKLLKADRYSIQLNETEHITLLPNYLQYINHSCHPNVFFDTTTMEMKTLEFIKKGEELSFFYPSTEWKMTEVFNCNCGNSECLGEIQGAAYLTYDNLVKYRLSKYILDKYRNLGKV